MEVAVGSLNQKIPLDKNSESQITPENLFEGLMDLINVLELLQSKF